MAAAKSRNARRKFPSADELIRRRLQRWRRVTRLKFARTDDNCQLYWLHDEPYTPPLQRLVASLNPRGNQPRARPRARSPRSQPIRAGASPPPAGGGDEGGSSGGGGGDGDGGDSDDGQRVIQLPLAELRPHPLSEQIYADAPSPELVESIKRLGVLVPVDVVRRDEGFVLLSGHSRHAAAEALGLKSIPARIVDVPPEMELEYLLECNRQRTKSFTQRLREADALEPYLRSQALARSKSGRGADGSGGRGRRKTPGTGGPGVSSRRTRDEVARRVGLSGKQLERLRAIAQKRPDLLQLVDGGKKSIGAAFSELRRAERRVEQTKLAAKVSPRGDCILGDSLKLLPKLDDERFAAIITDTPYLLSWERVVHERFGALDLSSDHGEWDQLSGAEADELIRTCARQFWRTLRAGGTLFLFPGDRLLGDWLITLRENGFEFPRPCLLARAKSNPPPSVRRGGWRSALEHIIYARKPGKDVFNYLGDSEMLSALSFPLVGDDRVHPTQKPVELIQRLIEVVTNPGDEVLDAFAGSGSTGEAALRCGRHVLLIEKDPTFHAVATDRLNRVSYEIQGNTETEGLR